MKKTIIAAAVSLMLGTAAAASAQAAAPAEWNEATTAVTEAISRGVAVGALEGATARGAHAIAPVLARPVRPVPPSPAEALRRGQTLVAHAASVADLATRQRDVTEAVMLLKPLAVSGNVDANYDIGYLLADGVGVPRDIAGATPYMRKAAGGGDARAAAWLAQALTGPEAQHYAAMHASLTQSAAKAVGATPVAVVNSLKPCVKTVPCTVTVPVAANAMPAPLATKVDTTAVKRAVAPGVVVAGSTTRATPTTSVPPPAGTGTTKAVCGNNPYTPSYVASLKRTILATSQRNIALSEEVATLQNRLSAKAAVPAALNAAAVKAINAGDYETALPKLREAAAANYAPAVANLGAMYLNGYVVKQNSRQAVALFSRAAEGGDATAAMNLWKIFKYGIGVQPDPARAAMELSAAERLKVGQKPRS